MSQSISPGFNQSSWSNTAQWILAFGSIASTLASAFLHLPSATSGALLSVSLMLLGLLHGASIYGWRGSLFFIVVCLCVSNLLENVSILTGFPFGWYHYSAGLGPKIFLVPMVIGPAYFGVGYLSWTLARAILGDKDASLSGARRFTVPVIASFIMVGWDLTIDPSQSTIQGNWLWHHGGSFFGVPLQNFLGWYFTVYVFFQLFALYVRHVHPVKRSSATNRPIAFAAPLLAYISILLPPLLHLVIGTQYELVKDPTGNVWQIHDIHITAALFCVFTLIPIWLLALFRSNE